jgi:hypothetical protein
LSGIGDPPPGDRRDWPAEDLARRQADASAEGSPSEEPTQEVAASPPEPPSDLPPGDQPPGDLVTESPWDVKVSGNRRRPTAAEQAVPWLIGLVLALAGMLIVLLALVFSSNEGLLPAYGSPTPEPTPARTPPPPTPTPEPSVEPSASLEPTPTPAPTPAFPPLEIAFMQRTAASGPIHLFTHDFAGSAAPVPQARDNRGVDVYDWSPDGSHGIALVDGNPLYLTPGSSAADLGDGFDGVMFAADSTTAWAVRATLAGANDRTDLLRMDVTSGAVTAVATWTYPHPVTFQESVQKEAQFADDGGFNRVYVLDDGTIVVSILGAPAIYTYNPATGTAGTTAREPLLWSPDGHLTVVLAESGANTRISVHGQANEERGAIGVTGLVSHVRWSTASNQVVFTMTTPVTGGVAQDLYLWDLRTGSLVQRLTQDLRSMGGEFRGAPERWRP